ncbi:MAG TPA: acetate--CoA ligase family protein [Terracidiphilus sp.]|nr:acetate--CoA ligase family protein [Terracidiphilus sp.]
MSLEEKEVVEAEKTNWTKAQFDRLLRPRSLVLVGASATPGSLGECVLVNLENSGYSGELFLVNPKRPVIRGRASLGSIDELPDGIDCAVLAVPGAAVVESARACGRKGVRSLIVFSAGFAESGEAGKAAQRELATIAREHAMLLVGPNCLGTVNFVDAIPLTFVVTPLQQAKERAGAAIISQSGALAAVVAVNMRHHRIALTYSITTGNEAAAGVEDFIEHLIGDERTRALALVVEQFRSPRRFLELARRARRNGQFIALLHPGKSGAARASAVTHTGAIAGDYEVMQTLVRHAGVILVESMEELVDVTQILVRCGEVPRAGAAVFTESGAFKALALDLCESTGLELPKLSPVTEQALRAALPAFIPASNPLDLTAQGLVDPELYRRTLPPVLEDDGFGSVVLGIILTEPGTTALKLPPILDAVKTLKPTKPVIFAALDEGAPFDAPEIEELRELGVACFPSPERALRALARVTALGSIAGASGTINDVERSTQKLKPGVLPEYKSKAALANFGIPIPEGRLARSLDEAILIAREIGYPVALKAQCADLPHKSDAGGVLLGIESEKDLSAAWETVHGNIARQCAELALDGVLVERMGESGVELIVGARNDSAWGPVLLAGFGGVLAEAIGDFRLMPPDLSCEEIVSELNRLKCGKLLRGFRGSPAVDIEAAAKIVHAVSQLLRSAPGIESIDINPVVVYPKGQGAVALDALITVGVTAGRDKGSEGREG